MNSESSQTQRAFSLTLGAVEKLCNRIDRMENSFIDRFAAIENRLVSIEQRLTDLEVKNMEVAAKHSEDIGKVFDLVASIGKNLLQES